MVFMPSSGEVYDLKAPLGGVHHGGGGVRHKCQSGATRRSSCVVIPDGQALMRQLDYTGLQWIKTTPYFSASVMARRPYLRREWIGSVLTNPLRTEVQANGRIRH
jgi:hypothetical protein